MATKSNANIWQEYISPLKQAANEHEESTWKSEYLACLEKFEKAMERQEKDVFNPNVHYRHVVNKNTLEILKFVDEIRGHALKSLNMQRKNMVDDMLSHHQLEADKQKIDLLEKEMKALDGLANQALKRIPYRQKSFIDGMTEAFNKAISMIYSPPKGEEYYAHKNNEVVLDKIDNLRREIRGLWKPPSSELSKKFSNLLKKTSDEKVTKELLRSEGFKKKVEDLRKDTDKGPEYTKCVKQLGFLVNNTAGITDTKAFYKLVSDINTMNKVIGENQRAAMDEDTFTKLKSLKNNPLGLSKEQKNKDILAIKATREKWKGKITANEKNVDELIKYCIDFVKPHIAKESRRSLKPLGRPRSAQSHVQRVVEAKNNIGT